MNETRHRHPVAVCLTAIIEATRDSWTPELMQTHIRPALHDRPTLVFVRCFEDLVRANMTAVNVVECRQKTSWGTGCMGSVWHGVGDHRRGDVMSA